MAVYRENGAEQPYIPLGIFKLRIPFVHYRFEIPEALQAMFMCATCLGAIPVLESALGLPYEIAWGMVIINGFLYFLHASLGDPVVPGWITPGIPLVVAYMTPAAIGPERVKMLIALQLVVSFFFFFMGITGAAKQLMARLPRSLQAGILLGAGIVGIYTEFAPNGRFNLYPITLGASGLLACILLFSSTFRSLRARSRFIDKLGSIGMLPAIILGVILGPLVGEIAVPNVEWGTFIYIPPIGKIWDTVSPFSIGFPTMEMYLSAIPLAFMLYVIAFGDLITSDALLTSAAAERPDEKIDLNPSRSNLICGIRNAIMALVAPYPQHCGPIWTAVTAAIGQRYKEGRKAVDSIFSGVGTFRMMTAIYIMLYPIASLLRPVLPIALSLTMIVTGLICLALGMSMCVTDKQRQIAGVIGCVLAVKGAAWGLAVGLILHFALDFNFIDRQPQEKA